MSLRRLLPVSGDAGVLASARMLAYGIGTVTPVVLARRLAVDDMGGYRDILLIAFTCMQVLQLGLPHSLYYLLPSRLERRWTAVTHSLLVLFVLAALLGVGLTVAGPLVAAGFQLPALGPVAPLIGVFVGLSVFSTLLDALPIADGRVQLAALTALGSEVLRSVLLLAAAIFAPSLPAVALALVGFALFRGLLLVGVARPYVSRGAWVDGAVARAQFDFAGPFAISLVLAAGAATIDKYLVSGIYGPLIFAIYALGMTTIPLVDILFNSQGDVVLSKMKVSRDNGDVETIRELWVGIVRSMGVFILPLFALLALIGSDLMSALYGERYAASGVIFTIYVFHLLRYVAPYGLLPRVYGETVFIFWASAAALAGTLVALLVCMAVWGYVGAAIAYVISVYLISLPQVWKGNRLLGVGIQRFLPWRNLARMAVATLIATLAAVLLRMVLQGQGWLALGATTGVFALVYLGGLVVVGELKRAPEQHPEVHRRREIDQFDAGAAIDQHAERGEARRERQAHASSIEPSDLTG